MDARDVIPSEQLLKEVRAELVLQGKSLSAFCRENGLTRQNVASALNGNWRGKKATELALKVVAIAGRAAK